MSSLFSNPLRVPSPFISTVTCHLQSVRTARRLTPQKYFHPTRETTSPLALHGTDNPKLAPMPPYPEKYARLYLSYPANNTGLYGGAKVQSGNNISKGRNKGKTLRRWYPNVRLEKIRSEALNEEFTIKITASCMRTIRKCGGLDQYLLGDKPARLQELGQLGWRLRWRVMNSRAMREKYREERENLGLPAPTPADQSFMAAWEVPEMREKLLEEQEIAWQALREKAVRFEDHARRQLVAGQFMENGKGQGWTLQTLMEQSPKSIPGLPSTLQVKR